MELCKQLTYIVSKLLRRFQVYPPHSKASPHITELFFTVELIVSHCSQHVGYMMTCDLTNTHQPTQNLFIYTSLSLLWIQEFLLPAWISLKIFSLLWNSTSISRILFSHLFSPHWEGGIRSTPTPTSLRTFSFALHWSPSQCKHFCSHGYLCRHVLCCVTNFFTLMSACLIWWLLICSTPTNPLKTFSFTLHWTELPRNALHWIVNYNVMETFLLAWISL